MARSAKASSSSPQDLITRISDTIADHPRVSAAAAFQMGVLLGQAMQNSGALKDIGRKMAAVPGAIASGVPTFGLFDSSAVAKPRTQRARAASRNSTARKTRRRARHTQP